MNPHPQPLPRNVWIYSHLADGYWLRAFENLEEFQAAELQHDDYIEPERECDR